MGIFDFFRKKEISENQFRCTKCKKVLNKKYLHTNQICVDCFSKAHVSTQCVESGTSTTTNHINYENKTQFDIISEMKKSSPSISTCSICGKNLTKSFYGGYPTCYKCEESIKKISGFAKPPETFSNYKTISLLDMDIHRHHYAQSESYGICTDGEHNYIFNYGIGNAGEGLSIVQCDNETVTKDNYKDIFYSRKRMNITDRISVKERLQFMAMMGYTQW